MAFNNNHPRPPISNVLDIQVNDNSEVLTINGKKFSYTFLKDFDVEKCIKDDREIFGTIPHTFKGDKPYCDVCHLALSDEIHYV